MVAYGWGVDGAFVVEADLALRPETDPRAPGGAVTTALCGHWEHDGPCRWPHNSHIDVEVVPARLRSVVIAINDRAQVVGQIERALRSDVGWQVVRFEVREIVDIERALALRLAAS